MGSRAITKKSKTNFGWAFFGLTRRQRKALFALYAFCRQVDDIVDETEGKDVAANELRRWREILERLDRPSIYDPPIASELAQAVSEFQIDLGDLHWIIDGVEMDLHQNRYEKIEDLLKYCDGVACAVGLATMAILGADRERTKEYAFSTGRALQLTNIIRDVGVDAQMGRIYLPQEDLKRFSVSEREIRQQLYSDRFKELMRFEAERAKNFYARSEAALDVSERRRYPASEIMRKTYRSLLSEIESKDFHVFLKKVAISKPKKCAIALSVWVPSLLRA